MILLLFVPCLIFSRFFNPDQHKWWMLNFSLKTQKFTLNLFVLFSPRIHQLHLYDTLYFLNLTIRRLLIKLISDSFHGIPLSFHLLVTHICFCVSVSVCLYICHFYWYYFYFRHSDMEFFRWRILIIYRFTQISDFILVFSSCTLWPSSTLFCSWEPSNDVEPNKSEVRFFSFYQRILYFLNLSSYYLSRCY